ncbi:unnamed protein product [Polarella glacialis]|uniref:Ketoreductase domain-containing protein n=1 Tax=Polarella glacialis TaxID=89957 RepID=A0A813KEZ4_POLGL|nr:unnamed protein product [Polarella glacialis]
MDTQVAGMIQEFAHVPRFFETYTKPQLNETVELTAEPLAKWSVLVFADRMGYCKSIFENAPENRISQMKVIEDCGSLTQDAVSRLVCEQKKGWDLIVFAAGIDPPDSNSVPDVIDQNAFVSRLYFWLLQEVQKADKSKRLFTLVRGLFHEDKKTHMQAGLGITVSGTLFGMSNTARIELEDVAIHFCDTEYLIAEASTIWARLASEAFRVISFGHNAVRILESGRYVQRQVSSKEYEAASKDFPIPAEGVIAISGGNGALGLVMGNWLVDKAIAQGVTGFSIEFLSRSAKISDMNLGLWEEIQVKASKIGVQVKQDKMDMSSQEGVDNFLKSVDGRLVGFIHSAGILQDAMLMNLTWEKFEAVFAPKHYAALYLHDALERYSNPKLRFLWVFSSIAVYGSMGQTNYSGSNSFLDALTRHRRAKGRPSMAVQWGAWGDVGMAATMNESMRARMQASPLPYFSNAEGIKGLECGLASGLPYFSVFKFNPKFMLQAVQPDSNTNECYARNFTSQFLPTPLPSSLDEKQLYTLFRMTYGGQSSPAFQGGERKVYDAYIAPAIADIEKEWGDDFRSW